jgi:hypothetical protein
VVEVQDNGMTQDQTIKLSRIYRSCINDIEDVLGISITGADEQRIIQILSDAFEQAAVVMNEPERKDRIY